MINPTSSDTRLAPAWGLVLPVADRGRQEWAWLGPALAGSLLALGFWPGRGLPPALALLTPLALLAGLGLAARLAQPAKGGLRLHRLLAVLFIGQLASMGWITGVLSPELRGAERLLGTVVLMALQGLLSLGSLALLARLTRRLCPPAWLAWPLAWWLWRLLLEKVWWGGGYGSFSLLLLDLPGAQLLVPILGPHLFEALLWGLALWASQPGAAWPGLRGAALLGLLLLPLQITWTTPDSEALAVVPVPAPAAPATWSIEARDRALARLRRALDRAPPRSLVVTSEVYFPEPPPARPEGEWADLLAQLAEQPRQLLLGTTLPHPQTPEQALMNVALLVSAADRGTIDYSVYAKQHLAPVGEALPWPGLLGGVADHWLNHARRRGRRAGPPALGEVLLVQGHRLGVMLCHEVAFDERAIPDAEALVVMADDRWNPDPRVAAQSLALARLRALETGKPLLRVSEGESPWLIDATGQARPALAQDALTPRNGLTPYARWRDQQVPLALALALALRPWARRRPSSPTTS